MKLINKILPVATLGCVAAVVTPLATSCGNDGFYSFDGTSVYVPKSAQAEMDKAHKESGQPYGVEDATDLFFKNLTENPKVFEEDLLYYWSSTMYAAKLEAQGVSDINISESLKVKYENIVVNKDKRTISYDVSGQGKLSFSPYSSNGAGTTVNSIDLKHFEASIKNVPYVCDYKGTDPTYVSHWWDIWHGFTGHTSYKKIDSRPISEILADDAYDSYDINITGKIDGICVMGVVQVFDNLEVQANKKNIHDLTSKEKCAINFFDNLGCIENSYHMVNILGDDN